MIGLGQEAEIEEITLQPEICGLMQFSMEWFIVWNGQLRFAFSDLGLPKVLLFSEGLIKECTHLHQSTPP